MLAVCVTFRLKDGAAEAFMPLMLQQARTSLSEEPECHQFDVCQSDDGQTVFLYELYTDKAAFGLHLTSQHFLTFDTAVKDLIADKEVATFSRL